MVTRAHYTSCGARPPLAAARAVIFAQMVEIRRLCRISGVNYNFAEVLARAGEPE